MDEPWIGSVEALIQWAARDVPFDSPDEEVLYRRLLSATYAPFFRRGVWLMQVSWDCDCTYLRSPAGLCWFATDIQAASEAIAEVNASCPADAPALQWCHDAIDDCWVEDPHFVDWHRYWWA
jgi:hypothetical protein